MRVPLCLITVILSLSIWVLCVAQDQQNDTSLTRRIDNSILETIDSRYAASVLVSVNGTILLHKGYGWTDSLKLFPVTEHTLFNIASITKSFTSIAIFNLEEKGLVNLSDTLPRFFTNVPVDKKSMTIQHLLLHTTGFYQNYISETVTQRDSAISLMLQDSLKFTPGTEFSYSNNNFQLLGAIIEIVTGKRYEDFIREIILSKATMNETKFWSEAATIDRTRLAGFKRQLDSAVLTRNWGYIGSAGIYTTVGDLNRWFSSLRNGEFISPKTVKKMWEPKVELTSTNVSSGWFVSTTEYGWQEIWTRGNEDWGHNGVLRWFPEQNTLIIVLTNSGEIGDAKMITGNREISDVITKLLFE